jgi:glycosyltransferase involved in cell wall biosynthesis/O-antigen/teichoic acid export membrane protein
LANASKNAAVNFAGETWSRLTTGIFGRGAVSFVLATAGVNISNFLFHVVISRQLGPSHYGAVGAILSLLGLLAVPVGAAQLAVTQAVIKHTAHDETFSLRRLTFRALLVGVFAMLAFGASAPLIDGFLHLHSPIPILWVSAWIPLATVGSVLQGALIGEYRFRTAAFATFVGGGPIRLVAGSVMVALGFGVSGAIVATIFAQIFSTGWLLFAARHQMGRGSEMFVVSTSRRDMLLSIFAIGSYTALLGIDTFLARHFFAASTAGEYAAGAVAAHIALFVPGAIVTVAFPHWASGKGVEASSRRAFREALRATAVLGTFTALVLAVFSGLVIHLLFGSSYDHAIGIVGVLAFGSAVIGITSLFIYLHLARRSLMALAPWLSVGFAIVLISLFHKTTLTVAFIMLGISFMTLVVTGVPAVWALAAATAFDATRDHSQIDMAPAKIDFTLVIPFYNPGSRFSGHVRDVIRVLESTGISFEVLAVSDGSTDNSEDQLRTIQSDHLSLVRLSQNSGKGAALRAGLQRGHGKYLGFIDGDGDLSADVLLVLIEVMQREQPDIIFGSKRHPGSQVVYPPLRRIYSWSYQQLNRLLFRLPIRDTQTGVKVFRRDVLAAVLPRMVEKRFAFDLELFVVARQQGFRHFVEMPVHIGQRFGSTVSLRSVKNMLVDTMAIFYRLQILHFYERDFRAKPEVTLMTRNYIDETASVDSVPVPIRKDQPKLRILILNWRDIAHPKAGGAEIYTHNVAIAWLNSGHEVTLFSAEVEGRPAIEDLDGLHIIRRGSRFSVYRKAKQYFLLEGQDKFDLVVDEINTRPFFAHRWVQDIPVVALIHQVCRELWFYQMSFPLAAVGRYWLEPKWLRSFRHVPTVTVSESSRASLAHYGLKEIMVVPEGHEELLVLPDVVRESQPTVVFVGRLEEHKRPRDAIRAFEILHAVMPSAILWVIGTGPLEDELRHTAPEGVVFLGKVSPAEKISRLARAHVLIATSVREGWGLVVTEAASVGTPTIAYDVAGLRDSVRASNGKLTKESPEALALALHHFLNSWTHEGFPSVTPGGVVPWSEVARRILTAAMKHNSHFNAGESSVNH